MGRGKIIIHLYLHIFITKLFSRSRSDINATFIIVNYYNFGP